MFSSTKTYLAQYRGQVPWRNSEQMIADIDRLPQGPPWEAEELVVGEGEYARDHILYKRSVIDVIRDLVGNPAFKQFMRYVPERHWTTRAQQSRIYGEMWTGDWWWRRQVCYFWNRVIQILTFRRRHFTGIRMVQLCQ